MIWAITKRELNAFFVTPIGWLCLLGFSLINGLIFTWIVAAYSDPTAINTGQVADINQQLIPDYFGTLSIILLLLSRFVHAQVFLRRSQTKNLSPALFLPLQYRNRAGKNSWVSSRLPFSYS